MDSEGLAESRSPLEDFSRLKQTVRLRKEEALEARVRSNPHPDMGEFYRGGFNESLDPQAREAVISLNNKGYPVEPSAGFWGRPDSHQVMSGHFRVDREATEELKKIGVVVETAANGWTKIMFSLEVADLTLMESKWNQIADLFPDRGKFLSCPPLPQTGQAQKFRLTYTPVDEQARRYHDFLCLRERVYVSRRRELQERLKRDSLPTEEELRVGAFAEELEEPVREAVFEMNRKGYPTDSSGFYGPFSTGQSMEGYFLIDEKTVSQLETMGVTVEDKRGLQKIIFWPEKAEEDLIRRRWREIVELFPDQGEPARPSTTTGAIEFRRKYGTKASKA